MNLETFANSPLFRWAMRSLGLVWFLAEKWTANSDHKPSLTNCLGCSGQLCDLRSFAYLLQLLSHLMIQPLIVQQKEENQTKQLKQPPGNLIYDCDTLSCGEIMA